MKIRTLLQVDCSGKIWVLKDGDLHSIRYSEAQENYSLEQHPTEVKLKDFAAYRAGFVGITVSGDVVTFDSTGGDLKVLAC